MEEMCQEMNTLKINYDEACVLIKNREVDGC